MLSIWAHPDDETFLAAGVMAAAVDRGDRVVCVSATAGERGTPDPEAWPPARLGALRRREAAAAMAVLGVTEHRILGYPDGELPAIDHEAGVARMVALITEVAPDIIVTFGPDGTTFHPDHITVHRWVTTAWERLQRPARLLYSATTSEHLSRFADLYEEWGVYMTDERPVGVRPDEVALQVVLEGQALDRKLAALAAMESQTRDVMATLDPDVFAADIAEECFVDAVLNAAAEAPGGAGVPTRVSTSERRVPVGLSERGRRSAWRRRRADPGLHL